MGRIIILDPAAISGMQGLTVIVKLVPVLVNVHVAMLGPIVVTVDPISIGPDCRPSTVDSLGEMGNIKDEKTLSKGVFALEPHTASAKVVIVVVGVGVVDANKGQSILIVAPKAQVGSIFGVAVVDEAASGIDIISIGEARLFALEMLSIILFSNPGMSCLPRKSQTCRKSC